MIRNGSAKIRRSYNGGKKIRRVYDGNKLLWSAGNIATYVIDATKTYRKEVESGENCLAAKYLDFEYKNVWKNWTFRGWKMDQDASLANLITQKIMGDDPITIYSVYSTPVTLSYNANGGSGSMQSKTSDRYYNNGFYKDAPFTLDENTFTKTGYTFLKWAVGGVSNPQYEAGAKIALATDATAYAIWKEKAFKEIGISNISNLFQAEYGKDIDGYYCVMLGSAIGSDQTGSAVWNVQVNFSGIDTIRIYYGCHSTGQGTGFQVYKCSSTTSLGTLIRDTGKLMPNSEDALGQYIDIDVSGVTGTGYIGIKGHTNGSYTKIGKIQYR